MLSAVRSSGLILIKIITSQINDLDLNFLRLSISSESLLSSFDDSEDMTSVKLKPDFRLCGIF